MQFLTSLRFFFLSDRPTCKPFKTKFAYNYEKKFAYSYGGKKNKNEEHKYISEKPLAELNV